MSVRTLHAAKIVRMDARVLLIWHVSLIALTPIRCHTPSVDAFLLTNRQTIEKCINIGVIVSRQTGARIRPCTDRINTLRFADRFTVTVDQPIATITNTHIRLHTMSQGAPFTQRYTIVTDFAVLCVTNANAWCYAISIGATTIAHRLTYERGTGVIGRVSRKTFALFRCNTGPILTGLRAHWTATDAIIHISFRAAWCR